MMLELNSHTLPIIFASLTALSVLIYVMLDGFDLGIGILFPSVNDTNKNLLIASIAPFWDMNESWLVLATGLILVAFPLAHGFIMYQLYTPIAFMLWGILLRGASIELRTIDHPKRIFLWNNCFYIGSLITSLSQGYMLGHYLQGFQNNIQSNAISLTISLLTVYAYRLLGACWLIAKTSSSLHKQSVNLALDSLYCLGLGFIFILFCIIINKQRLIISSEPKAITMQLLLALSLMTYFHLLRILSVSKNLIWLPYLYTLLLFFFINLELCLHTYPYIIPFSMTIWQGAARTDSLNIIFFGSLISLPSIIIYQGYVFWVFRGKTDLTDYHQSSYSRSRQKTNRFR